MAQFGSTVAEVAVRVMLTIWSRENPPALVKLPSTIAREWSGEIAMETAPTPASAAPSIRPKWGCPVSETARE